MDPLTIYSIIKIVIEFIKKYWPHITIGFLILTIFGIIIYYKIIISNLNDDFNKIKIEKNNLEQQVEVLDKSLKKEKENFDDIVKEYNKCIDENKMLNKSYSELFQILKSKNSYTISINDAITKERDKLNILKSECKKDGKEAILQITYECPKYVDIIKARNEIVNEFNKRDKK